jgi:hypothetical protein
MNVRLKEQSYCGESKCQKARKAAWQRKELKDNPKYKARQNQSKEHWRKKRPAHQYQREYRESHPDYVEDNRKKQRKRDEKRALKMSQKWFKKKIVKMDALIAQSPLYVMNSFKQDASTQQIVKMDRLIVQFIAAESDLRI